MSFYSFEDKFLVKRFHKLPNGFWTIDVLADLPTPTPNKNFWHSNNFVFNHNFNADNYVCILKEEDKKDLLKVIDKQKISLIFGNILISSYLLLFIF